MKKRLAGKKPIERVYKDGKEAIVLANKKKSQPIKAYFGNLDPKKPSKAIRSSEIKSDYVNINENDLPLTYNTTRITLIVKDPLWIYAYWEIARDSLENIRDQINGSLEECRYVVRMYDVTFIDFNGSNANRYFDIDVGRDANNWYVNLWCSDVTYCAEIGIIDKSGRFFSLARSNFVHTPRAYTSSRYEEIWMERNKEDFCKNRDRHYFSHNPGEWKNNVCPCFKRNRRIYLSADDIKRYYSRISPLLRDIVLSKLSNLKKFRYFYLQGGNNRRLDFLHGRFRRVFLGASESIFLGGSEERVGASESAKPEKTRKFFFEIGTELIVYGKTEPDAEVWLGEKKIELQKDGTFAMRFLLTDGKVPLNFTAVSKDKVDMKEINTAVERRTQLCTKDI